MTDPTGAAVSGAHISARNEDTRAARNAVTDASGQFTLRGLPIGSYTMTVGADGFAGVQVKPFLLSVGQVVVQRFELRPAGIIERVEVKEHPEAIDVAASTASVAIGYERIEEAPSRSRNYLNFVLVAPAVAPAAGSSSPRSMTGTRTTLGDSGFTFGGMRPRNNSILIDGMDNRDETTGGSRVSVGLEMVQEFRVSSTEVGAELGGAAGGLLNMVTRSGANIWHGDLTFFTQNEALNAARPEVTGAAKPEFRRYQPGTSANGPLRRDKTFVSGAVEYERESAQEWSNVPEAAVPLINRALLSEAFAGVPVRSVYRGLYDTSTRGTELSLKLNHQAGSKDTLSTRYAFSRGRVQHEVQGPDNFADRSAQGSSYTLDHSLVGSWLRVLSPSLVNEVRAQFGQRDVQFRPNASGPTLEIPGVVTMGQFYRLNADRTERHYQIVENLNLVLGAHRLSAGVDVHAVTLDADLRDRYGAVYIFPTISDFVRGRPDMLIQAFGNPQTELTTLPFGSWLQDRWELRQGLSLELGLRYDRQRMPARISPSSDNFAPRLGLAWRPYKTKPFVVRAGFGFFYDRYPLAYLNNALQKDGRQGFEQFAYGEQAWNAFADAKGAQLTTPLLGIGHTSYRTAAAFPSSYGRKVSVGMEYGLDKNTSLSIEASQLRGVHLPRLRNIATTAPPQFELEQTARSNFLGGSISLNRRMSGELAYLVAYNVGRTQDDGSDFDEQPMDPTNIRRDWSLSRQHQLHRLTASALFELPVEDTRQLPQLVREALEGISVAPIFTVGSGRPINALLTTDLYRTGAFPISARPLGLNRNPFQSQGSVGLDLRLMKTIRVMHDRAVLQFGVESFNLLNHTNTERVSQYFASPAERLGSYAGTLESLPARQVQFLMQFEY